MIDGDEIDAELNNNAVKLCCRKIHSSKKEELKLIRLTKHKTAGNAPIIFRGVPVQYKKITPALKAKNMRGFFLAIQ